MSEYGMSLEKSLMHVASKRWFINTNPGFMRQLKLYEKELSQKGNQVVQEMPEPNPTEKKE